MSDPSVPSLAPPERPRPGRPAPGLPARWLIASLRGYKRWLSPLLPRACRFSPTCSEYARLAVGKHGAVRGSLLAVGRLARCHPFHPGGIDLP